MQKYFTKERIVAYEICGATLSLWLGGVELTDKKKEQAIQSCENWMWYLQGDRSGRRAVRKELITSYLFIAPLALLLCAIITCCFIVITSSTSGFFENFKLILLVFGIPFCIPGMIICVLFPVYEDNFIYIGVAFCILCGIITRFTDFLSALIISIVIAFFIADTLSKTYKEAKLKEIEKQLNKLKNE